MEKYSDQWFNNYKKHRMLSKTTLEGNISISYYDQNKFHPVDVGEAHYIDLSEFATEYLVVQRDVSIKDLHKYCKYLIEYYNLAFLKNKWIKFDIEISKVDAFFDKRKYFCNKVFYYFNKEEFSNG